ncbi:MAG: DUF6351 family protein [Gammaproteobacteria bacterium]|nr:DUF6351 family protein [Gammaproteobacteria bacterium]MDP2142028.1 DUF6351 family protein [Gammaproteobacteria bacterium]MDP2348393.1 DUF6351 family protein [Gammaproteobacteria bacterium]
MEVVSNQPHLISGGNALIEITSTVAAANELSFKINELPVKFDIHSTGYADGLYTYKALVTGLADGTNTLQVTAGSGAAMMSLMNYPITGPIISGEHQTPYFCLAELSPEADGSKRRFAIGNGEFLDDAATDQFCSLPTRVDYVYRSNAEGETFKPLSDVSVRPADLAVTTTLEGVETPYIVRLETGTINRAIYQIAMLHDPATPAPTAHAPSVAWNDRVVYTFGGGCQPGFFQATSTGGVLRDSMLAEGYAVVSSTLNVNNTGGCNDVISAETAMMVKEHFIENYGEPVYTIGNGGSGGAMQQLLIAGAYPGILDGIIPSMTFPDAVSYMTDSEECAMPFRNFVNDPALGLSEETKAIIGGWPNWYLCDVSLGERPDRIAPDDCSEEIPVAERYDPVTNPNGVRCSIYDGMRNVFGEKLYPEINTAREFARSPHDNVGVQYGLVALNEGHIDKTLFLDLNEKIGGWSIDFMPTAERVAGDDDAIRIAYETGRITSGAAGLSMVPIIDDRTYLDFEGNFHASIYSFVTRARLERDNGHADNYVIRRHFSGLSLADENLALMDQWLAALKSDTSDLPLLDKIVRTKPADLQDDCFAENGERIVEKAVFDPDRLFDNTGSRCNSIFPPHAGLRLVAGGPLSNDVLKCQLKPIDYSDYNIAFTDEEKVRLEATFPEGVCDWSKPGVHQEVNEIWLSYGPSPVNRYQQ